MPVTGSWKQAVFVNFFFYKINKSQINHSHKNFQQRPKNPAQVQR